eukprot:scaffold2480_cov385-Prasinococcus_capsulatus_cf.AAC.7
MDVQTLTPSQLRAAFDAFDTNGDGVITAEELRATLTLLGVQLDEDEENNLMSRLKNECDGKMNFEQFEEWWMGKVQRKTSHLGVSIITSEAELQQILTNEAQEGQLVILEVGFTFCRPCAGFEKKFHKLAATYSDAICLRINGNENRSTIHLCRDKLGVKSTPSFYLYRAHPFIQVEDYELKWTGAKEEKFVGHVQSVLRPDEAGYDEANAIEIETPPEAAAAIEEPVEEKA